MLKNRAVRSWLKLRSIFFGATLASGIALASRVGQSCAIGGDCLSCGSCAVTVPLLLVPVMLEGVVRLVKEDE